MGRPMIAARHARRSLMDRILLSGMAWTDANPWFGVTGMAVAVVIGCCLKGLLP